MRKKTKTSNPYHICEDDFLSTNACTECTGLMPTPPEDGEEWETYQDIFHFTPESDTRKKSAPTENKP